MTNNLHHLILQNAPIIEMFGQTAVLSSTVEVQETEHCIESLHKDTAENKLKLSVKYINLMTPVRTGQ